MAAATHDETAIDPSTSARLHLQNQPRYVGWSALASSVSAVLGMVTFSLFMAIGSPFQMLADLSGVLLGTTILPIAWGLHRRSGAAVSSSGVVRVTGWVGGLLVALSSAVLAIGPGTLGLDTFGLETAATVGSGVVGIWLLGLAALEMANGLMGRRLTAAALAGGGGYVLLTVGFFLYSFEHPLTTVGGLVAVVGYTIWGIGLGRTILSGRPTGS